MHLRASRRRNLPHFLLAIARTGSKIAAMIVCGIDPGLDTTGYAIVRCDGVGRASILDAGILRTSPRANLADRLVQLADDFAEVLLQWKPAAVGVEQLYAHYKHPRTAIQMGHARGVLLAAAARNGATVSNFSATHVKKHLTGNGRASKTQVQQAVQSLFRLPSMPEPPDLADAIAIAFCCGNSATATVAPDESRDTTSLHASF
ncbi:MAG TPA: crossover junction endodeoxyribonuclease RuvC [Phycisphaerae bacterium]|nr:crossover junction endodeoxyribonuclease RuvC [Phycisphaerales bacterium]HRX85831.1 crossover junction endodeoxyribonuclease RuvC [Phycisphaerae bacterium]